ncbi:ran binding protein in the microtubule-organising centre [Poronia punctata]|nr:ran binding protein in the microtubule-organising centre [Poronia punctata]
MKHAFNTLVEDFRTQKSDINALILDYLTVAGYPNAAAKFSLEANLPAQQPTAAIQMRLNIRMLIHNGEIEKAIQDLHEVYPSILDDDDTLLFALLRLQLVELIRDCNNGPDRDVRAALKFAQTKLGPMAAANQAFLDDLEKTMSLLVFPQDKLEPSLAALLKPSFRREVADQVNGAISELQRQRDEAAIWQITRIRAWSEDVTRKDTKKDLPRLELGLDGDEDGAGDMITT